LSTVNIFDAPAPAPVVVSTGGFVLRDYQQEAVDKAVEYLKARHTHNGLLVLPTGSGKSLVVAGIIKALDEPTLVLQPSKEILWQNVEKFRSYGGRCGIYSASAGVKRLDDVTFATIGSVIKKLDKLERFRYILVDECDLINSAGGMYEELITTLGVKVMGLTATPYRLSRQTDMKTGMSQAILKFLTRTRPAVFSHVVYHVQNGRLFADGHLCKLVYQAQYGIKLPDWVIDETDLITLDNLITGELTSGAWTPLDEPVDGCFVVCSTASAAHHMGLYFGGGVLHTVRGFSSTYQPLARFRASFKNIVFGDWKP